MCSQHDTKTPTGSFSCKSNSVSYERFCRTRCEKEAQSKLASIPLHKEFRSMEHLPGFCCKLDKSKLFWVSSLGLLYKIRSSLFLVSTCDEVTGHHGVRHLGYHFTIFKVGEIQIFMKLIFNDHFFYITGYFLF